MERAIILVIMLACVVTYASDGFAWTDDVEGMLMTSTRDNDPMTDPQSVLENIEGATDNSSEKTVPMIEWE